MPPASRHDRSSASARVGVPGGGVVFLGDETALVEALRQRHPGAVGAFYDCYAPYVERLLRRIVGPDDEIADLHQEVFVRALDSIGNLEDPGALRAWLTGVCVHAARTFIKRRSRRWWLRLTPRGEFPERATTCASEEIQEAARVAYELLRQLPLDEREVFVLRSFDELELTQIAETTQVSLATVKRRLARAQERFAALARHQPALRPWLEGGSRWTSTAQ